MSVYVVNLCEERGWEVEVGGVGDGQGREGDGVVGEGKVEGKDIHVTNMDGNGEEVVAREGGGTGRAS